MNAARKSLDGPYAVRILFISQIVPYPPHGGVLQRGFNLIRELGRRHRVHLLAFVHPDVLGNAELVRASKESLSAYCDRIEYFDLWPKKSRLHRLGGFAWAALSNLPFSVLAHRSEAMRTRIRELAKADAFDIVHFDTLALAQYVELVRGVPSVLTHHNIESQLMERRAAREGHAAARWYVGQQALKIRNYELAQCGRFDLNIVVSDADGRSLHAMMPSLPVAVVPNGVDTLYFDASAVAMAPGPPTIIYTGGMNMFANRDAVLYFLNEVWPTVKREVPGVRFCVVGQDPPAQLLDFAARDAALLVTGYVDDVRPLVAGASLYVVPLRVGGGTRLKVLDAMSMGRAIVATSIGVEGIHATPGRNIVLADDPAEFARLTVELLRDPVLRARLGKEARALVEREYAWPIVGRQLQAAYEAARAGRRGGADRRSVAVAIDAR